MRRQQYRNRDRKNIGLNEHSSEYMGGEDFIYGRVDVIEFCELRAVSRVESS